MRDTGRSHSSVMFSLKSHASLSNPDCCPPSLPILTSYLIFQSCSACPTSGLCVMLCGNPTLRTNVEVEERMRQNRLSPVSTAMGQRFFCTTDSYRPNLPYVTLNSKHWGRGGPHPEPEWTVWKAHGTNCVQANLMLQKNHTLLLKSSQEGRRTVLHKTKWTIRDRGSTGEIKHQWNHQRERRTEGEWGGCTGQKWGEM